MASLPTEIIHPIVSFLYITPDSGSFTYRTRIKIADYATISRQWQAAVEAILWNRIKLLYGNHGDALEKLHQFTSGTADRRARAGYIRTLVWSPEINWGDLLDETGSDHAAYANRVHGFYHDQFCASLKDVFNMLDSWKDRQSNLELSLWVSDNDLLDPGNEAIEDEEMASLTTTDLWTRGQIPHSLHLTEDDIQDLPTLPFVRSFTVHDSGMTTVSPSAFFGILSRCPHVKHVAAGEGDFIPKSALLGLREQRQDVVKYLPLIPESVDTLTYELSSQRELAPNPMSNAGNYLSNNLDNFSIAFRMLSMRLRELRLHDVRISSSFFWPCEYENASPADQYWPNLEVLEVIDVPPFTADGKWIIDDDPNKDWEGDLDTYGWEYDSDYYAMRGIIKSHEVDHLYIAMAKAARQMPRLRRLKFCFRGEVGERGSMEYLKFDRDETGKARLSISTEWEYSLGEGVIKAWELKGNKADGFRNKWSVSLDRWPA
ncbi:hypothetical protein ASPWEDRAFT_166111 [Aspergillus wentii DTO 134E9]|uniref:DUF6546 domain-containing protein n=1 Tax=Aspergillus wentii DTO 134E9 TaxID=1073089 RepID=A0A1L9RYN6_ASPWE|nr:uncharacterized protein ASPWEDRAFT_166111 [Aspergillus wentii DTO 134E9]KAI9932457.1 hypothetical protein MW887_008698 [Aspergillus wentii]OJJ40025.1 hypothetical protein ASPWEDRAFT_166111 [Aspergillus wentii DTO 134E9]